MKKKISITVDEDNLPKIRESMILNRHKNKSQAVESFLQRLLEEKKPKVKLSISIDNEILAEIDKLVEKGIFRNRSHAVDFAIGLSKGGIENGR